MRRYLALAVALVALLGLWSTTATAVPTGNGSESGPHYTLNIIGTSDKNPDMTGNNGHRIFVPLSGPTKIKLTPGDDFAVLDANGTDREASFQLPDPDEDGDGVLDGTYTVYIRPLGGPGGSATLTTCAEVFEMVGYTVVNAKKSKIDPDAYCSLDFVGTDILTRNKGKSSFVDVTDALLTLRVEIQALDENGEPTGEIMELDVPLFDDAFSGYFWEYDNNGLRIAQLRFVYS